MRVAAAAVARRQPRRRTAPLRVGLRLLALRRATLLSLALLLALGCAGERSGDAGASSSAPPPREPDGPLVVYSGRSEQLIEPLVERFREELDVDVEVRYGDTATLTATLLREGTASPADAFLAHDAVALGSLSRRGLLRELPMDLVRRVPARFAAMEQRHDWVGLSARARTVVYNRGTHRPETLPQGLVQLGDQRFHGRFGIAPTTASFAEHMAVYRMVEGPKALDSLLAAIRDNAPRSFADDGAIVRAVARGEIDWGLVNHQHLLRELEGGAAGRLGTFFMRGGKASGFVNASGIGVLSDDPRALALVGFLLGGEAQREIASATYEYPLAADVPPAPGLPPLASLHTPAVDYADVAAVLGETETSMRRAGLLR